MSRALLVVLLCRAAFAGGPVVTTMPAPAAGVRVDRHHDALPARAIVRFGSARLYHGATVEGVAAVGGYVASVGGKGVRFWDSHDGRLVAEVALGAAHEADAAGGRLIVSDIESAIVFDTAPAIAARVIVHSADEVVTAVALANDGATAAVVTSPCRVHVVRLDGSGEHVTKCDLGDPRSVALDPKGLVALGDGDGDIVVIDTRNDKVVFHHAVAKASHAPKLRFIASDLIEARDATLVRWDVAAQRAKYEKSDLYSGEALGLAVSSDGRSIAIAGSDVEIIEVDQGTVRWKVAAPGAGPAFSIAFSGNSRVLVGTGDGAIEIHDAARGARIHLLPAADEAIRDLAFTSSDQLLVLGDQLRTYSLAAPDAAPSTMLEQAPPRAIAVAHNMLIVQDDTKTLRAFHLPDLHAGPSLAGRDGWLHGVSPDGAYAYTIELGAFDRVDVATMKLAPVALQPKGVECVAPGAGGAFAAVTIAKGPARYELLRWSAGGALTTSTPFDGAEDPRHCASAAGDVVIATSEDLLVVRRSGKVVRAHRGRSMWQVAADPKHHRIAFADDDNAVGLYDLDSGKTVELGRHEGRVDVLAFSPDGDRLATGGLDQSVVVWDVRQ